MSITIKKRTATSSTSDDTVTSADTHGSAKRPKVVVSVDVRAVDAPDFCSDVDHGLSPSQMLAIQSLADDVVVWTEKELVGKGTKKLYRMDKALVFFFDGKKFVKKDRVRIQAMMEAVMGKLSENDENVSSLQKFVLLAAESGICKLNTLPELVLQGYIVQRAPPVQAGDNKGYSE